MSKELQEAKTNLKNAENGIILKDKIYKKGFIILLIIVLGFGLFKVNQYNTKRIKNQIISGIIENLNKEVPENQCPLGLTVADKDKVYELVSVECVKSLGE